MLPKGSVPRMVLLQHCSNDDEVPDDQETSQEHSEDADCISCIKLVSAAQSTEILTL